MTDRDLIAPLTDAARRVGERLRARDRRAPGTTLGELAAQLEAADGAAAAELREELARLRPEAVFADEFDVAPPATGEVWLIDAVDGAVQYVHGLPQWCVALTLVRDLEPVVAVLHSPNLGETYAAAAGCGTTRDGAPVAPSAKREPAAALVGMGHPPFVARQPAAAAAAGRALGAVLPGVGAVRNLGPTSWQIADTAAGRLDAFWQFGTDPANLLGGALIAREAGAIVTDVSGRPWSARATSFLAAAPALHPGLLALLAAAECGVMTDMR